MPLRPWSKFWCSVILGNSTTIANTPRRSFCFGAASFWVTAQPALSTSIPSRCFGAASFWVTAQPKTFPGVVDASFGAASFWVTAQQCKMYLSTATGFGAASFWVTAQPYCRRRCADCSFGAASFWVTKEGAAHRPPLPSLGTVRCVRSRPTISRSIRSANGFVAKAFLRPS